MRRPQTLSSSPPDQPASPQHTRPASTHWRRALACAVLALLAATACGTNPEAYDNAFVVHIVAPTCEHVGTLEPLLVIEQTVGGIGKASRTEWRSMQRLRDCAEPPAGHPWNGEVLQVWVSDYDWHRGKPLRVQLGHRIDKAATWGIGDDDRMRIDHRHIFLGTIDVGASGGVYAPPDTLDASITQLHDRQECEKNTLLGCGAKWEHADLFTFQTSAKPPDHPRATPPQTAGIPTQ